MPARHAVHTSRSSLVRAIAIAVVLLPIADALANGQTRLEWDASPDPGVQGYIVRYGPVGKKYLWSVDVGNQTWAVIGDLLDDVVMMYAIEAYGADGARSGPSNVVDDADRVPMPASEMPASIAAALTVAPPVPDAPAATKAVSLPASAAATSPNALFESPAWTSMTPNAGQVVDDRGDVYALGGESTSWQGAQVLRNGSAVGGDWAANECIWAFSNLYCRAGEAWFLAERASGAWTPASDPHS